ncbi:MAG: hypothetical protein N2C12_12735 [Planctomycetales bacterium]
MNGGNSSLVNALGYLSVVKDESGNRIGGLLVLGDSGRPLEFHCTAPVRPNRAQEILYGPLLEEYLCGEQIGQALVAALSLPATLLLTDQTEILGLRHFIPHPVIQVGASSGNAADDEGQTGLPQLAFVERRGVQLSVRFEYEEDLIIASDLIESLGTSFDIIEPFERIHDAIVEAHGGGRQRSVA